MASMRGHSKVVWLLLRDGRASPLDALLLAAEHGRAQVVRLLLGDKRCCPGHHENYAIRWAAHQGHREVVRLLMGDKRVDPTALGNSAIRWAHQEGHTQTVNLLVGDKRVRTSLPPDLQDLASGYQYKVTQTHLFLLFRVPKDLTREILMFLFDL